MQNSRWGWVVVTGLAVVLGVIYGATFSSLSIFIDAITETFNCTREETGRAIAVFLVTTTLVSPATGWLIERVGPRWVTTVGALLAAFSYWLAAYSGSLNQLIGAMALAGIGVGASTYIPAFTLATQWIAPRSQGLAFGILMAGSSAGAIIFPIPLTSVLTTSGWRDGMTTVALLIAVFCVPLLIWLARPPVDQSASDQEAVTFAQHRTANQQLRLPRYWLWILVFTVAALSQLCIFVALVPYLVSIGYSPDQAAKFFAAKSATGFVGTLAFGMLTNRWGAKSVLVLGFIVSTFGIMLLLMAPSSAYGWGAVALFVLAWGSTAGLVNQLAPILLVEAVGDDCHFATLFGVGTLISGIGSAVGPQLVGHLVDTTHSYHSTILLSAGLLLFALPAIFWLRAPAASTLSSPATRLGT